MTNEITIDIEEILALPDNSITDAETIRQIGLATTKWNFLTKDIAGQLIEKIKKGYEVYGLYPHTMLPFKIIPDKIV